MYFYQSYQSALHESSNGSNSSDGREGESSCRVSTGTGGADSRSSCRGVHRARGRMRRCNRGENARLSGGEGSRGGSGGRSAASARADSSSLADGEVVCR